MTVNGEELHQKIKELIRKRAKIQAVKLVADETRMGLKQAKDMVDEIEKKYFPEK
jgi:ribosomal protein L7/L12